MTTLDGAWILLQAEVPTELPMLIRANLALSTRFPETVMAKEREMWELNSTEMPIAWVGGRGGVMGVEGWG